MRLLRKTFRVALLPLAALAAAAVFAPSAPPVASAATQPGVEASQPAERTETCDAQPRDRQQDWMKVVVRGALRLLAESS
jgi:hypothetical protein